MPPASFEHTVQQVVHEHPIVRHNPYTAWFAQGAMSVAELARFTQQFSVFSHQFVEAQLRKVMNAPDLDSYHAGKEILMNELGVVFRPPTGSTDATGPDEVSPIGTVEGSAYRHASAHFEWLLKFAAPLGLNFSDLGKRRHAEAATLAFCDALLVNFGSEDPDLAAGASYAVEHWAAAGFWKELIQGLQAFKARTGMPLNLGFWVFHDRLEQQHADHTADELRELLLQPGFSTLKFLDGAKQMLHAIECFWAGLADECIDPMPDSDAQVPVGQAPAIGAM